MINNINKKHRDLLTTRLVIHCPFVKKIIERLGLTDILRSHIATHGNEAIHAADTICLLVYNFTLGKNPLYKLNKWVNSLDFKCLHYDEFNSMQFNDDRFGRALDKLYQVDRASIMTEIVLSAIKSFEIELGRLHNDSTSVKAYGSIPGKTKSGLELTRGHSKDHRPDLKQLVFSLSISSDGGVPVHFKSYSGNRTDDTTHIETWNSLLKICPNRNFLYVADSKLCTDKQLHYIDENGGRAISIIPETWREVSKFKEKLKKSVIRKYEIMRRIKPGTTDETEYFYCYSGEYFSEKRGYRIHWIHSSEKVKRDKDARITKIKMAETALATLNADLNTRSYKTYERIEKKSKEILQRNNVASFLNIEIIEQLASHNKQIGKGRPSKHTQYEAITTKVYSLLWTRNVEVIKEYSKLDGLFPLISTDKELDSGEVLQAYKYQPNIEKTVLSI